MLLTLRILILGWTFFLTIYMCFYEWTDEWSSINTIYTVYIVIWATFIIGLAYSIYYDDIRVVEPLFVLMWIRFTLPLLDFEMRHTRDDPLKNINSFVNFGIAQNGMQALMNFILFCRDDERHKLKFAFGTSAVTIFT